LLIAHNPVVIAYRGRGSKMALFSPYGSIAARLLMCDPPELLKAQEE